MPASIFDRPRVDLRRRSVRDLSETIIARSAFALPDDRELLNAIYEKGMTAESVAKLRHQEPWRVRKRVRQVVSQVLSPQYAFVLRHREQWPPARRRVATACVLQGRTLREAARTLKLSLHTVRTELSIVNALYEAERS